MKIQANELKIGNYILYNEAVIAKVEKIESAEYNEYRGSGEPTVLFSIEGWMRSCEPRKLKPIPLTEEILLKCGFHKLIVDRNYHLELKIGNIKLLFFDTILQIGILGVSQYKWSSETRIEHLHQLQNLYFALTGKELEVKL